MKKAIIIVMALALALPLTSFAQWGPGSPNCDGDGPGPRHHGMRQGGGDGFGPGHGRMGGRDGMGIHMLLRNADEIGLNEEQQTELKTMAETFRLEQIDRKAALEKARVKLHSLMADDNAVEREVNAQIDELARLRADMQKMRYAHRQAVKQVLNDEQLDKIKELRKQRFEDRPGRGDGRGDGRKGRGRG